MLAAVARLCTRRFSSRYLIECSERGNSPINSNAVIGPSATSAASANHQHLIQFQISSVSCTRLDVAIVSHFRLPGTVTSEARIFPASDRRKSLEPAAVLPAAAALKGRPPRGREGRQQHIAKSKALEDIQVATSVSATVHKSTLEDSRRKLYELRRAERQRLNEAELDIKNAHNSELNEGTADDLAVDDEELCAVGSNLTPGSSISVNNNDFDYHMNVTASLASRQRVSQLIENGMVSVNDSVVTSKSHIVAEGKHSVSVSLPFGSKVPQAAIASAIPFPILYEDDAFLVICKPPGIVVHPTPSVHDACTPSVVSRLLEQGLLLPASQSAIHRFLSTF
jgi:hypothetical protein